MDFASILHRYIPCGTEKACIERCPQRSALPKSANPLRAALSADESGEKAARLSPNEMRDVL